MFRVWFRMLEVGFAELKLNYKRLASDLGDNPFDTLGVLALVESAQSKQTHLVTLGILMEFKGMLMHRFSKFIKDQVGDPRPAHSIMLRCYFVCRSAFLPQQTLFLWCVLSSSSMLSFASALQYAFSLSSVFFFCFFFSYYPQQTLWVFFPLFVVKCCTS